MRLVQLPSVFISHPVLLDNGWELFLLVLFPTMNFSSPSKVNLQADQEVKFELKNSSLETLPQDIPRYPWLLNILIHYTFLNKLNRFVFHLQSACELSVCFQRGHCFNWMNIWHLMLMSWCPMANTNSLKHVPVQTTCYHSYSCVQTLEQRWVCDSTDFPSYHGHYFLGRKKMNMFQKWTRRNRSKLNADDVTISDINCSNVNMIS